MTTWRIPFNRKPLRAPPAFVAAGYFFAGLYALLIIIPLYFVVVSAFKDNALIITAPLALPGGLDLKKFFQAQASVNLLHGVLISIVVTFGAELLTLLLAFPAAYAVARINTRLAGIAEGVFNLGFLIPGLAIL